MCGILAQYYFEPGFPLDQERFRAALDTLTRRGPDDFGVFGEDGVMIGMRRLSIIDLEGGHQPIGSEDRNLQAVCNGEIYNFRELTAALQGQGHRFRTKSDTEALVHLYEQYGPRGRSASSVALEASLRKTVNELNGMFGFAVFDRQARRLVMARDRMGIKPLYFLRTAKFIAFSSEIAPLRVLSPETVRPDPSQLPEFLSLGYLLGRHSGYTGVSRVLPSEVWSIDGDGARNFKYWQPDTNGELLGGGAFQEQLAATLPRVMERQLVSDVSTGLFLSGGLDSSLIAAVAKRDLGRDLPCFTLSFDDHSFDESPVAERVASSLGLSLRRVRCPAPSAGLLEDSLSAFAEPLADMSILPTFVLSRETAAHAKVVLAGDGGDELFYGYPTHFVTALHPWIKGLRHLPVSRALGCLKSGHSYLSFEAKLKHFAQGLSGSPVDSHFGWKRLLRSPEDFVRTEGFSGASDWVWGWKEMLADFGRAWSQLSGRGGVARAAWLDCLSFLPDDVLQKTDRITMHHSQEARVPLLDHELVDLAWRQPAPRMRPPFQTKKVFRTLLRQRYGLPKDVWSKPKQGFSPPLARWMNQELRPIFHSELPERAEKSGFFKRAPIVELLGAHDSGREDHARKIWAIYAALHWLGG